MPLPFSIACFVTDHGFGHASRAAAVMAALQRVAPGMRFELFTTCPRHIFSETLQRDYGYYRVRVDVGMVQLSPLEADMRATVQAIETWIPFDQALVDHLARTVTAARCRLVLCDISAMGIAVARAAGLPSVLIENFTWDWIYRHHRVQLPAMAQYVDFLENLYDQVDLRIQTVPLCRAVDGAERVGPISREPRTPPETIRACLKIPQNTKMILVSMGGVPDAHPFLERLPTELDAHIVIPGANGIPFSHKKVVALPTHSPFFHPDLLRAADLLVGKAGYSTIAEASHTGVPFGYIERTESPESQALVRYIQAHLSCRPVSVPEYQSGRWLEMLPDLLHLPRSRIPAINGADVAAAMLIDRFGH